MFCMYSNYLVKLVDVKSIANLVKDYITTKCFLKKLVTALEYLVTVAVDFREC